MSRIKSKKILAIETSCDETAMAILECSGGLRRPKFKILAEAVSSQIAIHRPFGGVVPNLAKREHLKNLPIVFKRIMNQELGIRGQKNNTIIHNSKFIIPNLIVVTVGPGLEPALWTGINFAQGLGKQLKVPVIGANHLEGHIYSNWIESGISNPAGGEARQGQQEIGNKNKFPIAFPAICLIVSGGHTILLLMKSLTLWQILGETRDDAVGEAFDKVAKMLNLPYPGGPEVEKLALKFKGGLVKFPRPMIYEKNYDFSFSGLKTAVLYYLRNHKKINKSQVCASFQKAAIEVLVHKTMKAVEGFSAKSVLLCGGVACNKALQKSLKQKAQSEKLMFFVPPIKYNTDNAVMIAAAAYLSKKKYKLEARGNLSI